MARDDRDYIRFEISPDTQPIDSYSSGSLSIEVKNNDKFSALGNVEVFVYPDPEIVDLNGCSPPALYTYTRIDKAPQSGSLKQATCKLSKSGAPGIATVETELAYEDASDPMMKGTRYLNIQVSVS